MPLPPQTRHLINQNSVEHIKDEASIINIARRVHQKEALFALQKRGIAFGLDVIEDEEALFAQKLFTRPIWPPILKRRLLAFSSFHSKILAIS